MPFSSFFISALSVLFLVGGIVSSFSVLHRESSVRRFSESLQAPEYLFSAGAPRLASDDVKGRGSSSVGHTKLYSTWLGEGSPFFPTVLGLPPGDARVARGVAKHLFRSSTMASTVTQRMALLCDASESLQQALRLEPEDPMTALAWIELEYLSLASRQQQPQFSCSSSLADEDDLRASLPRFESTSEFLSFSEPALERIQASAPSNPSIQFQLGRFAEQLGFDELAATAYRRYLVLVPTTGSAQAQRIEEWIAPQEGRSEGRPGARLLAVVPPHLPQVSFWSRRLRDESVVRRELAQLQRTAIESRWKEVQGEKGDGDSLSSEQISLAQFLDELLTLSPLSATDEVRREIDATILHIADVFSSSLRGSPRHSSFQGGILGAGVEEFLSVRALKTRLAVVPGWNISDLRPEQGMLSQWASTERLAFDRKYRSLGFAVGPREGVSLITVATAAPLTPDILSRLKLYVSEDNVEWQELPQNHLSVELVMLGGQSIIVFQIREQRLARLWKIHFASKSQEEKILGRGEELLAVYGELR